MLGVSSELSMLGNRARLVPATRRAPGLDVGGEGSEHFLSGEVGATHNQAMAVSWGRNKRIRQEKDSWAGVEGTPAA